MPVIERVSPEQILERVSAALGDAVTSIQLNHGQVDLECQPQNLVDIIRKLRTGEGLRFQFFTFLSAVDRSEFGGGEGEKAGGLEVLIHLYSPDFVMHVNIHVPVILGDASCPSITGEFAGANWHEREMHEMFGIDFPGHPGLTNLYLPEDFEGHPGLRSFKLPSRSIKDWPGAKDPEEAAAGGR